MKFTYLLTALAVCLPGSLPAHPGHTGPHESPPGPPPQSVVVVEYSGFDCAPCARVSGLLGKLATEKKLALQILFKHSPGNPEALLAHEAALAAGQQGKFWEMHDRIFAGSVSSYEGILELAKSLQLDMKRFQTAVDEREFRDRVMTDMTEARGLGIRIAPTLFINGTKLEGIDQIQAFVDSALTPRKDTLDPGRTYDFDLTGSPNTGPADAPVTLVEFSDFRCGFCGAHSRNIDALMEIYPGKIRRVFKHFPIQVNEEGTLAHFGSMAAMGQGKFWEMYRALMNQPLKNQDDLFSRAVAVGLDMQRFAADLTAGQGKATVLRDVQEGDRTGISLTPTTFINGKPLSGRQTLDSLKKHLDAILGSSPVIDAPTETADLDADDCCGKGPISADDAPVPVSGVAERDPIK